jgi:hypothetical protein
MKVVGHCLPPRTPKQVDAIDEHGRLVLADVGCSERLADAVCFRDHIGVHEGDCQAESMAPYTHCLVEMRQSHQDGAAGSSCPDNKNVQWPVLQKFLRQGVLDTHITSCRRERTARVSAVSG